MRKLATIQTISEVNNLENSDKLDVVKILGWKCVVGRNEYKVGDLVVYIEIDSVLPELPEFEFLRSKCFVDNGLVKGFRVKTIRLRGQYSQGIVFPLSILDGKKWFSDTRESPRYTWKEGQEVTGLIGIIQFDKPIPASMSGQAKGLFPVFIPKTDETRVQVLQDMLDKYKGSKCYITEKMDGTSTTFYLKDGEFGVCSRNLEFKPDDCSYHEMPKNIIKRSDGMYQHINDSGEGIGEPFKEIPRPSENIYWKMARKYKVEEKLKVLGKNVAIQCETYGNGLQGNPLKITQQRCEVFNIYDIDNGKYLSLTEMQEFLQKLSPEFSEDNGTNDEEHPMLSLVPVLEEEFILINDIDKLVEYSKGNSIINSKAKREGIVIRPLLEVYDNNYSEVCKASRISFKVINPEYLIANDE